MKAFYASLLCILSFSTGKASTQFTLNTIPAGCFAYCNGVARITPSTGYRYHWSNGDSLSFLGNLCAGSYTCTVTDTLGVSVDTILQVNIAQPAQLLLVSNAQSSSCPGADNGAITLTALGGTPPYYYLVTQLDSGYSFTSSGTFTGLDSGYYHIALVDVNECGVSDTLYVGLESSVCTGIKDIPQLSDFTLQPNPAIEVTKIVYELNEPTPFKICLLDMTGKQVQQVYNETAVKGQHTIAINLSQLLLGVYILNVASENGSFNTKLVKQ